MPVVRIIDDHRVMLSDEAAAEYDHWEAVVCELSRLPAESESTNHAQELRDRRDAHYRKFLECLKCRPE